VSRWLKLDTDTYKHPKVVALTGDQFRAYIAAMSEQKNLNGEPFASEHHFAVCVGIYAEHLPALLAAHLIDRLPAGRLAVHNFASRQVSPESRHVARQQRYRDRHKASSPPVENPVENDPNEHETVNEGVTVDAPVDASVDAGSAVNNGVNGRRTSDGGEREGERDKRTSEGRSRKKEGRNRATAAVDPTVAAEHRRQVQAFVKRFGIAPGEEPA